MEKPKKTIEERIAAGEFGERRKRYGAPGGIDPLVTGSVYDVASKRAGTRGKDPFLEADLRADDATWEEHIVAQAAHDDTAVPLDRIITR